MIADRPAGWRLFKRGDVIAGKFSAMGCLCEVLFDTDDQNLARRLLVAAAEETRRIELKFSRYEEKSVLSRINRSGAKAVEVDDETAQLIDFAHRCYDLSNGLFDITSGVLGRVWKFNQSSAVPRPADVNALLDCIGLEKVSWKRPAIKLLPGMEIDLGGLGKEYAVDRVRVLIENQSDVGFLVNFGGDIAVGGTKKKDSAWTVGIERDDPNKDPWTTVQIKQGALATSGDSKRHILSDGKRYGHILNPRTGWPVTEAPRSVTVAARTCSEAGFLSTVGMLNGRKAEVFLKSAGVKFWCYR